MIRKVICKETFQEFQRLITAVAYLQIPSTTAVAWPISISLFSIKMETSFKMK
jgi:hypothetical protein